MVGSSTYYSLVLYDSSDTTEVFLDYRLDMCGTSNSNMTKIDTALNDIQTDVDNIIEGAIPVYATYVSGTQYNATGTGITAYATDLQIILRLDTTSNGTLTLDVDSLGVKTVYKIDNAGSVQNIDGNDLGVNKEYLARYNGTAWVIISAIQNVGVMKKNTETLATSKTFTDYDYPIQYLDPDGVDRDVFLPAEGVYNPLFVIYNTAGGDEDLVVKEDSGTTTIATVAQGQIGYFISNGTSWKGFISETGYTLGDIPFAVSATQMGLLGIGTGLQLLRVNAGATGYEWVTKDIAGDVLTTEGDVLYRDASGLQRLAKGTANQLLKMNAGATAPEWVTKDIAGDVLTTSGDILYRDGSGLARLAVGTNGYFLTLTAGAPAWSALPVSDITTQGVIEVATTAEVTAGTDTGRAVVPDALAGSIFGIKSAVFQLVDPTTDVSTGIKVEFEVPESIVGMNLISAYGRVTTAGTTGSQTISVERYRSSWLDMLSSDISIASGANADDGTVNTSNDDIASGDLIRITIDAVHTTVAKGCSVTLEFQIP